MAKTSAIMLLRVAAWTCLGLTVVCAARAVWAPDDFGYILLGVPLVMLAMLAHLEMQHLDSTAGLLPRRRAAKPRGAATVGRQHR